MNMQILYGNDGVNYRILAETYDTEDQVVKELGKGHFLSYDFTKKNYPDGTEPESLSFVTSTLNGALGSKHILVSKSMRMGTFITPCYMSHVHIMEIYDGMRSYTNKSIYKLCNMEFISSDKAEKYANGSLRLDDFDGRSLEDGIDNEYNCGITDKAREAIISLLAGCDGNPGKVTVAVDAEEENYNKRVKEIILDIYTHMPYGWRSRFGFCSFITINSQSPDGVKLQFVESGTRPEGFQNFLDLNIHYDEYFEEQMKNVRTEYREYVCGFLYKTEEKRLMFFNQLSQIFNIDNEVSGYCEWKKNLAVWDADIKKIRNNETGDNKKQVLELVGSWTNFIEEHGSGYSALLENLRNKIKNYIKENEQVLLYLQDENRTYLKIYCKNALNGDIKTLKQCRQILKRYARFLNFINCQYSVGDVEKFIDEVFQNEDKIGNSDIRKQKLDNLNKCIKDFCTGPGTMFYNAFYQEWSEIYFKKIQEENDIEERKEKRKEKEKESISQMFSQKRHYEKDYSGYFKKFNSFDLENKEFFKQKAGEWLLNTEIDVFQKSYEDEEKWCNEHLDYIYEDNIKEYLERFKEEQYKQKEEHWKNILLNNKNKLCDALEMLHGEVADEKSDIQERAAVFLSGWLDGNLRKRIKIERADSANIKKIFDKMDWLMDFVGMPRFNKWIDIINFKKCKLLNKWTNIKNVFLFMEYVETLGDGEQDIEQNTIGMLYNKEKEKYIFSDGKGEFTISMDLWDAKKLAEFILEPEKGTNLSLDEDTFIKVLDSSLLDARHWMLLFDKDYSRNINDIWEKYFSGYVLVPDKYIMQIKDKIIGKETKEAKHNNRMEYVIPEKELQYERIISDMNLAELKKCQQNWEMLVIMMPPALAALLQMFLIKTFSYKIAGTGLYSALLMSVAGLVFIGSIFIPKNNSLNKNKKIYKITEGIMFLLLGWIVMGLNLLV
ncbi:MAG: hypothetical protein HFH68_00725 [Lachnospiraceae bacterium]|nr:hypothetical protein [Lachnospiraceae bacterium]